MGYLTTADRAVHQAIPNSCTAKALGPGQRLTIGVQGLAGHHTITALAEQQGVSRNFVYRQVHTAKDALEEAFAPTSNDDRVLFHLPVTRAWLRQLTLGLILICHSSYRGVVELCRDLLDVDLSLGTVHNIARQAVGRARRRNAEVRLGHIEVAALDEIFQAGRPVLVGADVHSTYCFLLRQERHRDGDTWGVRLLELTERGLDPRATVADFGTGIRSGVCQALPGKLCRGDVFHALRDVTALATYLENRAYEAIAACDKLRKAKAKLRRRGLSSPSLGRQLNLAQQAEARAVALADDVTVLGRWLRGDVLALSALPYAERVALYDFVLAELEARRPLCPHRLGPVCTLLANHRDDLLAFAAQLEQDLGRLAADFAVPVAVVREVFDLEGLDRGRPGRWQHEAALRRRLGRRFWPLRQAVRWARGQAVRSSSVIENLNSRLRNYFFLRRHLGDDYLELLQFFLNHRRFLRSECAERVDRSPAELLTGQEHSHWLELLGYKRFSRG